MQRKVPIFNQKSPYKFSTLKGAELTETRPSYLGVLLKGIILKAYSKVTEINYTTALVKMFILSLQAIPKSLSFIHDQGNRVIRNPDCIPYIQILKALIIITFSVFWIIINDEIINIESIGYLHNDFPHWIVDILVFFFHLSLSIWGTTFPAIVLGGIPKKTVTIIFQSSCLLSILPAVPLTVIFLMLSIFSGARYANSYGISFAPSDFWSTFFLITLITWLSRVIMKVLTRHLKREDLFSVISTGVGVGLSAFLGNQKYIASLYWAILCWLLLKKMFTNGKRQDLTFERRILNVSSSVASGFLIPKFLGSTVLYPDVSVRMAFGAFVWVYLSARSRQMLTPFIGAICAFIISFYSQIGSVPIIASESISKMGLTLIGSILGFLMGISGGMIIAYIVSFFSLGIPFALTISGLMNIHQDFREKLNRANISDASYLIISVIVILIGVFLGKDLSSYISYLIDWI